MNSIFISSTFLDMQQERDVIQRKVMPEIKDFVKQYGENIEVCDLRWGVNTLDMNERDSMLKVIRVCFDEIDRARPFFIAIIGERYGDIPSEDVVKIGLSGRNIPIEDMLNKSVTEMEIIYGALNTDDQSCVRFYLRNIENEQKKLHDSTEILRRFLGMNNENKKRVIALRNWIKSQFPQKTKEYSVAWNHERSRLEGLDHFAEMLINDLKEMIIEKWGEPIILSDYDRQFYQYQYALENTSNISDTAILFPQTGTTEDYSELNTPDMKTQNYFLVSKNDYDLDLIFSKLTHLYAANHLEIIPYDCSQSLLSSTVENMVCYYVTILSSRYGVSIDTNNDIQNINTSDEIKRFHSVLKQVDQNTGNKVVLAISKAHYLNLENLIEWFPLIQLKNIHFLVSLDRIIPMPTTIKKTSNVFYFPNSSIFEQNMVMNSILLKYHKELDKNVSSAILQKSIGKRMRYTEFLMQRLLLMSQSDFEKIAESGSGMQSISRYQLSLLNVAPDNMEDMLFEQILQLELDIGREFVRAVLSILSILPYGISQIELEHVLQAGKTDFSTLSLSLLTRGLPTVIIDTMDGYYRITDNEINEIIRRRMVADVAHWTKTLCNYLIQLNHEEVAHNESTRDLYRGQYLYVAWMNNQKNAISDYLQNIEYDTTYFSLVLNHLIKSGNIDNWLIENVNSFSEDNRRWFVEDFCKYISQRRVTTKKEIGKCILMMLNTMIPFIEEKASASNKEKDNRLLFKSLYFAGETAFFIEDEVAEEYLKKAKRVSKDNFRSHPNRLWRLMHGIELTEEERKLGYSEAEKITGKAVPDGILFGFSGETEDMDLEQSWSSEVRVINNYLSTIYHQKGDDDMSELLRTESKRITNMGDPDPFQQGENRINEYTTIIWPDQIESSNQKQKGVSMKRKYKPDLRRNSAIEISKEAKRILIQGNKEAALLKYEESIKILKEIYEDGKDGKYYDLFDVIGDLDAIRIQIQKECARDLGINYSEMLYCIPIVQGDSRITECIQAMISNGLIYDEYKNNRQSKSDLEGYYLAAAEIYTMFDQSSVYYNRILDYVNQYLSYRLEAHQNGEQTDQEIMEERKKADRIIYQTVTENPSLGNRTVDFLQRHMNEATKVDDFNGYTDLINLTRTLLQWMYDNSYDWKGKQCSLEALYIACAQNLCMLWQKYGMKDRLKLDVDILCKLLPNLRETDNIMSACQSIQRYQMVLLYDGEYETANRYGEAILTSLKKQENKIPLSNVVIAQDKLIASYSESGRLTQAKQVAIAEEALLERMTRDGLSENEIRLGMTQEKFKQFIINSKLTLYLNYAIVCSRLGDDLNAKEYLFMSEKLMNEYPDIAATQVGLAERISLYKEIGLPKSKDKEDTEKEYRGYLSEIDKSLYECVNGHYTADDLIRIQLLIHKISAMPMHKIFENKELFVKYHATLSQLYRKIGRIDDAAYEMKKAVEIIEKNKEVKELFAETYNDMSAYEEQDAKKVYYVQMAIHIYEQLRKEGQPYSESNYAMALFNSGLLLMKRQQFNEALERAEKAYFIWEKQYAENNDRQIMLYMSKAKRLVEYIKNLQ